MTNKFLSSEYGKKIRELVLNQAQLREILNISSLDIFEGTSIYPINITIQNKPPNPEEEIIIKIFEDLAHFMDFSPNHLATIAQSSLSIFPGKIIPIAGNIKQVETLCLKFKSLEEVFEDLKVIYRPYGFLNWAKNFEYINEHQKTNKDLILLGTGNVGKYQIKFRKRIKIAKKNIPISYFTYNEDIQELHSQLGKEKLIFREIAKDLTFVYDPGIFTNITGLYFLQIPSFSTLDYFSLLTVLNSTHMNSIFKTLYGTLHMSGGYLRCNGSFIKRLPIIENLPEELGLLGKINQFLSQLKYDLHSPTSNKLREELNSIQTFVEKEIDEIIKLFKNLSDRLVYLLYFKENDIDAAEHYSYLFQYLKSSLRIPNIELGYTTRDFTMPLTLNIKKATLISNLNELFTFYHQFTQDQNLRVL